LSIESLSLTHLFRSLYKYARYFARRHPKVTEDEKAVGVVVRLEEDAASKANGMGRHLTVRTMRAQSVSSRYSTMSDDDASALSILLPEYEDEPSLQSMVEPKINGLGMTTEMRQQEQIGASDFAAPRPSAPRPRNGSPHVGFQDQWRSDSEARHARGADDPHWV
jgi:hypothetical protein